VLTVYTAIPVPVERISACRRGGDDLLPAARRRAPTVHVVDAPRITAAHLAATVELSEPRLSPDARSVAYATAGPGGAALVVQPVAGGPARPVTADPPPRPGRWDGGGCFCWTPDGRALVHTAGDGGLWRTALEGGPSVRLVSLGDGEDGPAQAPAISPDGSLIAYVVDTHHLHVLDLASGADTVVSDADFVVDPVWHPGGSRLAWHEWDVPDMAWDASRVAAAAVRPVRRAEGSGPVVLAGAGDVQVQQPRWSPDGRHLAFLSDATGWLTLWVADADGRDARPVLPDGHEVGGPTWGHGQRSFVWSPDGGALAFIRNEDGFAQLCTVGVQSGHVTPIARGWHAGLDWHGDMIVAVRSGARTPTQVVAYEVGRWARTVLAVGPHGVFDGDHPEPDLVTWPSDDGMAIPGRLYRAPGALEPSRLIVWVHGGPTSQWPVTFNPRLAYWLDRGWSILVPDHRGSTGHGRAFTQALREGWGERDVADVAAAVHAAIERGWAHPAQVVAMGGSAGGFTVLHLLARHPGLVAAGVVSYPVTDLVRLDETTHRFEAHYNTSLVGRRPEADERYGERSPITSAAQVRDPLLIFQGDADEVVDVEQARAFAAAAGPPVELVVYEGEGHGFRRPDTLTDELTRTEAFLRRHVG
jgi:dipeptidyl aminopeptidase/acylaminoacyl peptidase